MKTTTTDNMQELTADDLRALGGGSPGVFTLRCHAGDTAGSKPDVSSS